MFILRRLNEDEKALILRRLKMRKSCCLSSSVSGHEVRRTEIGETSSDAGAKIQVSCGVGNYISNFRESSLNNHSGGQKRRRWFALSLQRGYLHDRELLVICA
jgi:hypothetical protein